ncbi:MAG TPA: STAS domain-containing protein [Selenomonadales bacterium]|nr:STAS domain-containing protein [Selenomonadales bacterium]
MTLGFHIADSRVIVTLKGNVFLDEALTLKARLLEFLEQGYIDFVLDMKGLNYIDNSGLGVLVAIHKQALRNGGGMEIVAISKTAQATLELTRLVRFFPARTRCVSVSGGED